MLAAHLVPGYFAAAKSQPYWKSKWRRNQRVLLWVVALGSTVAPDLDVIYNTLFRGFINHSTLWTHSLFVYLGVGTIWWLLRRIGHWPYLKTLTGLVVIGGLSHLALDVISHGTPLLYPVSLLMVGSAPTRIVEGGFWAYMTNSTFLLEPALLTVVAVHWILTRESSLRLRATAITFLVIGLALFAATFLSLVPMLQKVVGDL